VIRGDEVEACSSPGVGSGRTDSASGSPSALYSTVNKKSPHKHFHITSYVIHTAGMLKYLTGYELNFPPLKGSVASRIRVLF